MYKNFVITEIQTSAILVVTYKIAKFISLSICNICTTNFLVCMLSLYRILSSVTRSSVTRTFPGPKGVPVRLENLLGEDYHETWKLFKNYQNPHHAS